jgi:hypothetical protein
MKKLIYTLFLASIMLTIPVLVGCIRVDLAEEAGPITTRTYDFTDFTGIDVEHALEVTITQSENYSVEITAGENVFEKIHVYQNGTTLVIDVDFWFTSWIINPKLTVTMPVLTELELSGACVGTAMGFESSLDMRLHLSGASELDIDMEAGDFFAELSGASRLSGRLLAASTEIELSGASRVNLTGSGGNIKLDGSGASVVELLDFTVNNAYIDFSGASRVNMDVNGRLDVSLSGASSLEYTGNPTMGETDISGSSSMHQIVAQ